MAFLPTTIVSGLFKLLLDKLTTELTSEYHLRRDMRNEIEKLHQTLSLIERVIEDAEEKQINDTAVREWLRSLKQVTLEADDVLDDYATRVALKTRGEDGSGPSNNSIIISIERMVWKIRTCCNLFPDIFTNGDIAHSIKDIRERLDHIANNRSSLGLQAVSSGTRRFEITTQWQRPDTTSVLADESSVLGRDKDKHKIIQLLLSSTNEAGSNNNNKSYVSILPIVGMGGVGKTTLAQLVYNDKTIKDHFPLRMWVCISNNFDVERVTKEIIESSSKSNQNTDALTNLGTMTNLDAIQHKLIKVVEGKLFLLVLDDVWNEKDSSKWHNLLEPLKFGGKGSKVIVTTRSKKVVDIIPRRMDSINLGTLSPDDLWQVFQKFAFGDTRVEHMQLELIGKQIAERLKGLPLAAKTVGCLLNSNLDVEHWRRISQSAILALDQGEDDILPALKLSFDYLSPRLKQCFTYCSLFPKNHKFDKGELVHLWMAQCMIQSERGLGIEDIGSDYFDDLISRSFFQLHPDGDSYYLMHDLIHDLAEFESKDDCFRIGDVSMEIPKTVRHILLFTEKLQPTKVINLCTYENLRTLLFLREYKFDFSLVLNELFTKLKRLRVLGLHGCRVEELPESFGELKHLRYMDLSDTPLEKLSDSLSRLHNLQVLRLKGSYRLHALPKGITKLINLKHLIAEESLISSIEGIGNLSSLQKLNSFDACKHKIREMKGMNQLRELSIKRLECVKGKQEACQVEMNGNNHMKKLTLEWSNENRDINTQICRLDEEVLQGLQSNADLVNLTITGYAGMNFPSWITTSSFLETIFLVDCSHVAFLPPVGQLSFLKHLRISGMSGIKQVGHVFYGSNRVMKKAFPSLVILEFQNMSEREVWKGAEKGQSFFPRLRTLYIEDCPKLMELPPLPPSLIVLRMENLGVTVLPGFQEGTSSTTSQAALSSSLTELSIQQCPSLTSLSNGLLVCQLGALKKLTIRDIKECVSEGALPSLLQNCSSLERLEISSKLLRCFPVTKSGVLPSSLQYLKITGDDTTNINKKNIASFDEGLPYRCLQQLTSLVHLYICGCQSLKSLPGEVLCHLTSLNYLYISNCEQLISLELQPLTSLGSLVISFELLGCLPVTEVGVLPSCLQYLTIMGGDGSTNIINNNNIAPSLDEGLLLHRCLQQLTSLGELYIRGCLSLTSLPREVLHHLTSLKYLEISNCQQLTSLELQPLTSLRKSYIGDCPKLTVTTSSSSLSSTSSPSPLVQLSISNCSNLLTTGGLLQSFPSLEDLRIGSCENLQSLPTELGSLSSLKILEIHSCPHLGFLPTELGNLSALKILRLDNCPQIQSLPDIERLPTSLDELDIEECPTLKERCKRERGPDWHKISHIPYISIDAELI